MGTVAGAAVSTTPPNQRDVKGKVRGMSNISATADKATLSYRVVSGKNPQDRSQIILRPLIVNKESYDTGRVLHFCLDNGYIQGGQFYANFGVVNGFLEGCQRLGLDGRDILLNNWLRIYPMLRGVCNPETRQMGPNCEIHVCCQAQKDLRVKASQFNWICVDDNGLRTTVQHLQSVGGKKDKEIFASAKICVGGTNLNYTAATDKVTAEWDTTDEEGEVTHHNVTITPESSGYSQMILPFPTELASAPVGTEVVFTFFLRNGNAEASVIPAVSKAKVVSAS